MEKITENTTLNNKKNNKTKLLIIGIGVICFSILIVYMYNKNNNSLKLSGGEARINEEKTPWKDLMDGNNVFLSDDKGGETNVSATEGGKIVASFDDKANQGKVRVRYYADGKWFDAEDEKDPKGLISLGKAEKPVIDTKGEEIFVAFTEIDYNNKSRVMEWDGNSWKNLSDPNHPDGFITNFYSEEPVISFDKSKKYLYAMFAESKGGADSVDMRKLKMLRWDGIKWNDIKNNGNEYITDSYSGEADLHPSNVDESTMYTAYEDFTNSNKIRVEKWDGKSWSILKGNKYPDGFVGNKPGYSPAIAIGKNDEIYLVFSDAKPGKTFVYKWDGKDWNPLGKDDGLVAPEDTIESNIASDNNTGEVFISYSEYKKDVVEKIAKKTGEKSYKEKELWRVKVKKFDNNSWVDVIDDNRGYISKGDGKGDPSLVFYGDRLYIIFTDEENHNAARVRFYDTK